MSSRRIVVALALGAFVLVQQLTEAQELSNRADRKITGQYFRPNTASTYHRGALSHAEALNYYGQRYSKIPAETAKEHTAEIRRNLNAAKKEFAKLEKEAKGNKQVETHLKAIQEHQAKAEEMCKTLEEEPTDGKMIATCCQDITKELKAAETENAKLKKALGVEEPDEDK